MKLDLHVEANAAVGSQEAVSKLVNYFVANGLTRKVVKRRRIEDRLREVGTEMAIKVEEPTAPGSNSG